VHKKRAESLLLDLAAAIGFRVIVHPTESGRRWVQECVERFSNACGANAVRDVSDKQRPYDIIVCGKKVQCKYRSRNRSGVIKIRNSHRASGGWYAQEEVDYFAIAYETEHFIVPYTALLRKDGTFLNDMRSSRLRRFRDAWDLRSEELPVQNGFLFGEEMFTDGQGE
jgi:hypothetical protein